MIISNPKLTYPFLFSCQYVKFTHVSFPAPKHIQKARLVDKPQEDGPDSKRQYIVAADSTTSTPQTNRYKQKQTISTPKPGMLKSCHSVEIFHHIPPLININSCTRWVPGSCRPHPQVSIVDWVRLTKPACVQVGSPSLYSLAPSLCQNTAHSLHPAIVWRGELFHNYITSWDPTGAGISVIHGSYDILFIFDDISRNFRCWGALRNL